MPATLPQLTPLADDRGLFDELSPAPRLLMGPGPINAHPRVLQALSAPLLGQFDPQFRAYMKETMSLYRRVFETDNAWTLVVDGTARAAIECAMVSLIESGDRVLVLSFGRFGQLMSEIARRKLLLKDLAAEEFVLLKLDSSSFAAYLNQCCVDAGFMPRASQYVVESQAIPSLVAAGLGVALVPASLASVHRRGVEYRTLAGAVPRADVHALSRRDDPSATVRGFLEKAREILAARK